MVNLCSVHGLYDPLTAVTVCAVQYMHVQSGLRMLTHRYHQGVHSMQSPPLPCF